MTRAHWDNCIAHFDDDVSEFAHSYFADIKRKCLLISAAGFDPRAQKVPALLARTLGDRLSAIFIREERDRPDPALLEKADANEVALREIVTDARVESIEVFGDDGAAVGGSRIAALLSNISISDDITDVVLDLSAISIGIGFPAAKILLENCENAATRAFHLLIVSNPELDGRILSESADNAMSVKGFSGIGHLNSTLESAQIWLPQLAEGRKRVLTSIGAAISDRYKVCPMLPFPARDPRRADNLIGEYQNELVNEWQVDPRDLVYVSEWNPLDTYRSISLLKQRYDRTVEGIYFPRMILSPVGSKVVAAGALMAAIEHDLTVQYIEAVRYELNGDPSQGLAQDDQLVHVLLSGPVYGDYRKIIEEEYQ